jgi:twitching motility protein PilT
MAVLDGFINAMMKKKANALVLETGHAVMVDFKGERHNITKDPLQTVMILAFLKEIIPEGMRAQLEGGDGRVACQYLCEGMPLDVEINRVGQYVAALVSPSQPRRSQAAISIPAEALRMNAPGSERNPAKAERSSVEHPVHAIAVAEEHIQQLLQRLVDTGSSDLHLRAGRLPTYRTTGQLWPCEDFEPLTADEIERILIAIMPERNKEEFAETNDSDFAYEVSGMARFRVNALWDRRGPAAVFRIIRSDIPTADELGLDPGVQQLCQLTKGLVLITGPTGSGKSTTLAAMTDLINRTRAEHVLTIEDPIEFVHEEKKALITQRQVGNHTPSFKRALRAALREDPDIILIGEMRDLETIEIAMETAETGHLVFGTLHTTTAATTIDRIIDQFPADRQDQIRVMLSESLKAVIAQVLLRTLDGKRVAAREILYINTAMGNIIRQGKTFQITSLMQTSKRQGMITLNDALIQLVEKKIVSPEEAYLKSSDQKGFELLLRERKIKLAAAAELVA